MDDVFGEIMGLGYGSDSILLRLLRSAMDEAHENVQSKDGSIGLLNARSKFYEMAMILVEGCSKLIEEKPQIPEINREKMLSDLKESRDMVRGRLEELKFSIFGKDIELVEQIENEFRLKQTLESKENELVSLRAKLELERTKSEELLNYQASGKEEKEGDFCDLKNSVDQQMLSIKQKLEDERMSLSSANDLFGDENFEEGLTKGPRPEQSLVIEQMSSDIDCLKGTLDLAFGRMQNAEIGPLEKQWRWKIEKDTILISISGFMSYVREIFEVKFDRKIENQIPFCFSSEQWSGFINEITSLHNKLKAFTSDVNEAQEKGMCTQEKCESSMKLCKASSEPLPESDYVESSNQDQDSDSSTYVAKMIKNPESIIRKQREELNWIKIRDIFRGKESYFGMKNIDPDNLGGKIKEVISRLDYFIKWNAKLRHQEGVREKREVPEKEEIGDEMKNLQQDRDDLNMQTILIEEIYVTLMKGSIKDLYKVFRSYELESLIKDDIGICILRQVVNGGKFLLECTSVDETIESILKEDVYIVIFRSVIEDFVIEIDRNNFENLIREEIYNFIILEAAKNETELAREAQFHEQSRSKKSACEEENLIHKPDSPEKCFENKEELLQNDDLGLRNSDGEQLLNPISSCLTFVPLAEFQSTVNEFESMVHQKLQLNFLRLEELAQKTQNLVPSVSSLKKEELLYKKAFEIRCHNLRLAETEVDLLGDQVEELVGVLKKIYLILDQNSSIPSCDFRVSDILI